MKLFKLIGITLISIILLSADNKEYRISGIIDSVRTKGYITLIIETESDSKEYVVINNDEIIGKIDSLEKTESLNGKNRYIAFFHAKDDLSKKLLKAGMVVSLKKPDKIFDKRDENTVFQEKPVYKPEIITNIDKREMVLIPSGKFQFGSSEGDDDEYPEQMINLNEYYIDKYEVSNEDYRIYADKKYLKFPEYWKEKINTNGEFTDLYFSRLPVIVTYYEAENYAKWAGKRLPDEREWEKAAKYPPEKSRGNSWSKYTWGSTFKNGISNTAELWESENTGVNIKTIVKEKYKLNTLYKGLLPVDIYENEAVTFYGIIHMDGNASEWTCSWYKAYPSNTRPDKKYGTQFKVIRGGSFNLNQNQSRVTDRKIGGIPDLYKDRIAGFRCVKSVTDNDRK